MRLAEPVDTLEEQRRQYETAHVGEVGEHLGGDGEGEVATAKVGERDERIIRPSLGGDESVRRRRDDEESSQHAGTRPAPLRSTVQPKEQRAHRERERAGAKPVEVTFRPRGLSSRAVVDAPR